MLFSTYAQWSDANFRFEYKVNIRARVYVMCESEKGQALYDKGVIQAMTCHSTMS